ncbi:MAG TPA: methionine--tRNA ligase [Sandaracinaceae bacterium LLY-WYZ-13_1]|nr:methionine--tRNA ligase [Sandaracinaceae bacterium LLY-WYZ-13_1]
MTEHRRILVTAALPYANGPIHLGHLAGAYLPADVFCRYQRLAGRDCVFICGSDEHGAAIVVQALKEGTSPREIVDRYHAMAEKDFAAFGMSFDHYGRTSSETHRETAQAFFRTMAEADAFVVRTEEQLYDPEAELFLADRFVVGTCPNPDCNHPDAYGDQCEKCGRALSPKELLSPRSTLSDATPELREVTHWYLPLGELQPKVEAWIGTKTHWKSNVLGQVKSWFASGLGDRAMTRDIPWGVPVPEDVAKKAGVDPEGKVLYVWFDAPIGYVSATREWAAKAGDPERWKTYWQREDTRLVHFIGKDNIVFHTISFPAMLMVHGDYVLPENVPANEFLNLEGDKLSTSKGWAVWLGEALEAFPADYLRYALLRVLPETRDADFTWNDFQAHVNNELADNLGNFFNRTVSFAGKYLDGVVPPLKDATEADMHVFNQLAGYPDRIGALIDESRLREAVNELMSLSRLGNKYFNDAEPWATRKSDMDRCGDTIHVSLQLCAALSILAEPFLPFTAKRMRQILRFDGVRESEPGGPTEGLGWDDAGRALLDAGHALGAPEILVRKVEDEAVQAQRDLLESRAAEAAGASEGPPFAPLGETIEFGDFAKLDLRVGVVEVAERVKKSRKLIRCEVDLGFETRQVLAGVAEHMSAEELQGRRVIVVANLKPRKMVGLESQGMLLMAEDRDGRLTPVTADSEPGSTVR